MAVKDNMTNFAITGYDLFSFKDGAFLDYFNTELYACESTSNIKLFESTFLAQIVAHLKKETCT